MKLNELIWHLMKYRAVVVSGCQRSGTHIMAKIIGAELGWRYLTDNDYDVDNFNGWAKAVLGGHHIAIQCPHMTHILHLVPPDVAVVYMLRPASEITESFMRVNPGTVQASQAYQMLFYSTMPGVDGDQDDIKWIRVRDMYWQGYQSVVLNGRGFSFQYHDLEEHPMFYKKHQRKGWTMNQTEPKGE